jgi:hypothetical protein
MPAAPKPAPKPVAPTIFRVAVSFDGLNQGEEFTQQPDDLDWAMRHVATGYLEVVPQEEAQDAGEAGQG